MTEPGEPAAPDDPSFRRSAAIRAGRRRASECGIPMQSVGTRKAALLLALILLAQNLVSAADIPPPAKVLGFRPGDDFRLAAWPQVVDYFKQVDRASDRVVVRELGRTTEDRPYVVAIVSSADTIARLDHYRDLQHRVADPRLAGPDPIEESKPVVLVTCSIHSNETASTLMAAELLHDLATRDDPATRETLDNTILLLVPSANPDGVDKVAEWYEQSKGHPWEGEGMPRLYHKYAGHDTNRDWFMLNLVETRILTKLLYHEWFPTITYDVHQMGTKGARLFVPPFFDPINPNLDPRVSQGIFLLGSHMASDLAAAGKKGVLTNAMYDNWWNGGNRTTPQRHNMVGVLTEAASVRMASPIFVEVSELGGTTRGFGSHRPAVNFVDPWPGGWWRLRDIVDYELISARSVLTMASRYRRQFQSNYRAMARDAIARGKTEPPFAWIVPADQRDPARAAKMVGILRATGVEVKRAKSPFTAAGATYPAGSWIFPASQPYRAHLKDMMERQVYPPRFAADGSAEPPYDVAGWTLPLQMGVRAVAVDGAFASEAEDVDRVEAPRGSIVGDEDAAEYLLDGAADDIYRVINDLFREGFGTASDGSSDAKAIRVLVAAAEIDPQHEIGGRAAVRPSPKAWDILDRSLARNHVRLVARKEALPRGVIVRERLSPRRLGLYQPWMPSMDEGWTRLILEDFGFPFTTLHNAEIRPGKLRQRFDVIMIPSIPENAMRNGYADGATAPPYVGGLGVEGAAALREFAEAGGLIIGLEDACNYLIHELNLPVKNVLAGLKTSEFYGPGSIVGAEMTESALLGAGREDWNPEPILGGVPERLSVYFDRSLAFESSHASVTPLLRYAAERTLESGWLHGAARIQGKTALAKVKVGQGHVILFGFPPQHRGQTQGTFRLLFNAILRG
ncbi:MAG TPA: M14 metallopeptidase family protein [Isosphaeraceae bacterium]